LELQLGAQVIAPNDEKSKLVVLALDGQSFKNVIDNTSDPLLVITCDNSSSFCFFIGND
jgi:hypothetical protein